MISSSLMVKFILTHKLFKVSKLTKIFKKEETMFKKFNKSKNKVLQGTKLIKFKEKIRIKKLKIYLKQKITIGYKSEAVYFLKTYK